MSWSVEEGLLCEAAHGADDDASAVCKFTKPQSSFANDDTTADVAEDDASALCEFAKPWTPIAGVDETGDADVFDARSDWNGGREDTLTDMSEEHVSVFVMPKAGSGRVRGKEAPSCVIIEQEEISLSLCVSGEKKVARDVGGGDGGKPTSLVFDDATMTSGVRVVTAELTDVNVKDDAIADTGDIKASSVSVDADGDEVSIARRAAHGDGDDTGDDDDGDGEFLRVGRGEERVTVAVNRGGGDKRAASS
jgi:hypothetical protein